MAWSLGKSYCARPRIICTRMFFRNPMCSGSRRLRSALKLFGDTMLTWIWQPFHKLSLDQLYAALMLRQRIFVIEQACLYLDADGVDPQCWHGLGYLPTGELAAYARIVPPASRYPEPSIG